MSCDEIIWSYSHNKRTCKQSLVYFMHLKFNSRCLIQWWEAYLSSVFEAGNSRFLWRRNLKVQPVVKLWWNSAPFVLLDIFKMAGLAPASEEVRSFTVLWSGVYFNCSSTVKELRFWIASFENTGNLETSTFLRWPLICYVAFVCLCFGKNRGP